MANRHEIQTVGTVADQFRRFAASECEYSPLYKVFCDAVIHDPALLALAKNTKPGQLAPNILFASIQFLILNGTQHPLAHFYRNVPDDLVSSHTDLIASLRAFCQEYQSPLEALIRDGIVQTNEVRRCACFLPALYLVNQQCNYLGFHFIDVGASAGLLTNWDKYKYRYGNSMPLGKAQSSVQIRCECKGTIPLPIGGLFPRMLSAVGLELEPIDVHNAEQVAWLRSFISPNQPERTELFYESVKILQQTSPHIIGGDASLSLGPQLDSYPNNEPLCLLFSFSVNQMFQDGRPGIAPLLLKKSHTRPIFAVFIGNFGHEYPEIFLSKYYRGEIQEHRLARCHRHGDWIEWLAR